MKTPAGLASLLELSPNKQKAIKRASLRGIMHSRTTSVEELGKDEPARKRSRFISNVVAGLSPIVDSICSMPTFNGKSDSVGVTKLVYERMNKQKKTRRNLFSVKASPVSQPSPPVRTRMAPCVHKILHPVLKEFAPLWQEAMRQCDRETSRHILQLTVKMIPRGSGTVSHAY